jgi:hypothetical protein
MPNYLCLVRARLVVFQRYPVEKQEPKTKEKPIKCGWAMHGRVGPLKWLELQKP